MKIKGTNCRGSKSIEYTTVLEAVRDCYVFSTERQENGLFRMEELCEGHYHVVLTKEQLITLGQELIDLANK